MIDSSGVLTKLQNEKNCFFIKFFKFFLSVALLAVKFYPISCMVLCSKLININTCVFHVSNAVQKETEAAKLLLAVYKCCCTRLGLHVVKARRCWDVKTHEPIFTNKTEQLA